MKMEIDSKVYEKLISLSRRTLHTAFVWNDHNFESPEAMAKETAASNGILNTDEANEFMASLPLIPYHKYFEANESVDRKSGT